MRMDRDDKQILGPHAEAAAAERRERAAQALRDNLRRRKAQARARTADAGDAATPAGEPDPDGGQR
jgi:hypothetical protein